MPDWTKRVREEKAADLEEGEQLIAASFFQGRGTAAGIVAGGMIGGVRGEPGQHQAKRAQAQAKRRKQGELNTFEGSIAAGLPDDKGVIAVTDRRLLVFGIKQGMLKMKIQDVRSSIPREQLTGWTYKPGKLTSILAMAFADDSDVAIEMPRVNKPDAFAEAAGVPFAR